ncbi:unnamed protein product [Penicillium roqueforti FM164]|uniref:Genomic scaffold, ProqFM164S01 n=1 Tax=Penicillium roqueforti (strain FM164) TaxID=1365484 RepID=W6PZM5_PENRF|nr:unnamed protein product [Penicillium roqueforti FM164]
MNPLILLGRAFLQLKRERVWKIGLPVRSAVLKPHTSNQSIIQYAFPLEAAMKPY